METIAITDAVAAPTMPKDGIKIMFNTTFKVAAVNVANIINRGFPIPTKVTPQGPTKLLIINPTDKILRTFAEDI